jgi:Bacterial protein of unknown function (DUF899)
MATQVSPIQSPHVVSHEEWVSARELSELFDGRSQLVVQPLMFSPSWDEACKSYSF